MGTTAEHQPRPYSVELCGGTHVRRTGDIGLFKIVGESAVAAGVRRLEAVTGAAAEAWVAEQDRVLKDSAAALKIAPAELPARIAALVEDRRKLEREVAELRKKLVTGGGAGAAAEPEAETVAGIKFIGRVLDGVPGKDLKGMADAFKAKLGSGVVALVGVDDGKVSVVVGVTPDLTGAKSAVDLVKAGAAAVGGKGGGGRPDLAQAGGPDATKAADAVSAIRAALG
ncbi:MAG: DHHA1 domain-containing protein, partial [Rhodospirillaceae bacterium]|nr:DHHA1 domain-containing protein [Rhodospirillaceae bacterium]